MIICTVSHKLNSEGCDSIFQEKRRRESKDQEQRRGGLGGRAQFSRELCVVSLEYQAFEERLLRRSG